MTSYRNRVKSLVDASQALVGDIESDLDEKEGGIGIWRGQVGWKYSAELGEYLLSACGGISDSIIKSALACQEYSEVSTAQNYALACGWREVQERGGSRDELLGVTQSLGEQGRRREDRLAAWSEQAIVSLAQTLDRAAAVVAIVAAINEDVVRIDWGKLQNLARRSSARGGSRGLLQGTLAELGSQGRVLQDSILSSVLFSEGYGPKDWLPWLSKMRNTMVHRAPRGGLQQMVTSGGRVSGFVKPFPKQPDWIGLRALLENAEDGPAGSYLNSDPQEILNGLCESTVKLLSVVVDECLEIWRKRREQPDLLVQPGKSWRSASMPVVLEFPGYGEPMRTSNDEVAMNPRMLTRFRAARLMDDQRHLWRD